MEVINPKAETTSEDLQFKSNSILLDIKKNRKIGM